MTDSLTRYAHTHTRVHSHALRTHTCTHTSIHIRAYTRTRAYAHVHAYRHIHAHMHMCMHTHEYMHVTCMYMRTYTCMQAYMRPYTRAHTHIHAYACIHTSMHTHTCTYTCICMHICTCIRLEQRTMPNGNPLASAPGEDPFIQQERTNQHLLLPFRASPPSLDHQSGGTRTHNQGAPVGIYTSKHQEEQSESPSPQLADPLNHH